MSSAPDDDDALNTLLDDLEDGLPTPTTSSPAPTDDPLSALDAFDPPPANQQASSPHPPPAHSPQGEQVEQLAPNDDTRSDDDAHEDEDEDDFSLAERLRAGRATSPLSSGSDGVEDLRQGELEDDAPLLRQRVAPPPGPAQAPAPAPAPVPVHLPMEHYAEPHEYEFNPPRSPVPPAPISAFWETAIKLGCRGLIVLGLLEVVMVVVGSARFTGSGAARLLALLGLAGLCLAVVCLYSLRLVGVDAKRSMSGFNLTFHGGLIVLVDLLIFSVAVLALRRYFGEYVELHWDHVYAAHHPKYTAATAREHTSAMIAVVGTLGLLTAAMMSLVMVGLTRYRPFQLINLQAFLWSHVAVGLWSAVLIGMGVYAYHHQVDVPVSAHESSLTLLLGFLALSMTLLGIVRIYTWVRANPLQNRAVVHFLGLLVLSVFTTCYAVIFFVRSRRMDAYLSQSNEFARFGMYSVEKDDDLAKLKLSGSIQLSLWGCMCLAAGVHAAVAAQLASHLDAVLHRIQKLLHVPN